MAGSNSKAAPVVPPQHDDDRVIDSTAESAPIVSLPLKPNNVQVLLDPRTYPQEYRVMIEFLQNHSLNRALTLTNPNVPELYVQEFWQTLMIENDEMLVGNFGHPISTEDAVNIPITRKKIARLFHLPQYYIENEQGDILSNPALEANPSVEALLAFINFLGYNEPLTKLSEFKRKKLPPMWNVLVSIPTSR